MKLPVPIRLLKERYFGEASRNAWVAKNRLASLAPRLPPEVAAVVDEAVPVLIDYQDPDYALLYMERIERHLGVPGFDPPTLAAIAQRMLARMQYEDPICVARTVVRDAGGEGVLPNPAFQTVKRKFRWAEIAALLPPNTASQVNDALKMLHALDRIVVLRFNAACRSGVLWLKAWTLSQRMRPFSSRFRAERAWVERWLHMMDRSCGRQPGAIPAIVETADLIEGCGLVYDTGMKKWNLIIDQLVKPACDGELAIADLGEAVRRANRTAIENADVGRLRQVIAEITATAGKAANAPEGSAA
ncbi:MAG: indolepyruvate oxidoreductase subunit IorB [Bradyrhizobiaceae bacterium]|nr:MAG: indolepyruvate oxidoreductase subunit IorB [Bradyrhizobiaceae bacterium]